MVTKKETPQTRKISTGAKKTPIQVEANAKHIEENTQEIRNNTSMIHLLYGIIIVLLVVIAGLAYFVGTQTGNNNIGALPGGTQTPTTSAQDVVVRIIDDERCTDCETDAITAQLKALPFLAGANFVEEDFADSGVEQYLKDNNITTLPAVIFNSNTLADGGQITTYLQALPDNSYSLAIGANFNPFAKRSEKGYLVVEQDVISEIQQDSHIIGNENAKITWLEYSDVNCFYCKKMKKDGTVSTVSEEVGDDLNHAYVNFIGVGGTATQNAAEALECIANVGGSDAYNYAFSQSLAEEKNAISDLLSYAESQGVDTQSVQSCIDNGESKSRVETQFNKAREIFGVEGTPGNILLNTETGEYRLISGAYGSETFISAINEMLK